jgi:hypothetical protein
MYNKKKIYNSTNKEINEWAKLYTESLTEKELSESTTDDDILNTAFSTLLYFLCGEGNVVLKDDEWVNYLVNDINAAIQKGMFKPSFNDKQHIKKLQEIRLGEDEDDLTEDEEETSDEA